MIRRFGCGKQAIEQMKKHRPLGPVLVRDKLSRTGTAEDDAVMRWVQRKPLRSSATGPPGVTMMPGFAPKAKTRGRLNRAVLVMLGKGLEQCFDEIRKQEVPERFKLLLQQF
jgi:hypothetical protein